MARQRFVSSVLYMVISKFLLENIWMAKDVLSVRKGRSSLLNLKKSLETNLD